jgi:diguanylate cyclase (GGDEF)-like protein
MSDEAGASGTHNIEAENKALKLQVGELQRALAETQNQLRSRSEKVQEVLYRISETSHSSKDLQDIFYRIHTIIGELIPAANLFIALYDADSGLVRFPYYVDEFDAPPEPRLLSDQGLTQRVIRTGEAVLMTPEMREERLKNGEQIIGSICLDWLGVPLVESGKTIGALVIQSYSGDVRYSSADTELLQFVSSQVASAIVRKGDADRILHLALHDGLTGLPNRTLLQDRALHSIAVAKRRSTKFAWVCLDLDRFKPINDSFGHAIGDEVLAQVSGRIQACLRNSDTLARIGGDEFALLLEAIDDADAALGVAEKIRVALSKPFIVDGHTLHLSVSIGIAMFPEHGDDQISLSKRADTALYAAKNSGRNAVQIAGSCRSDGRTP